jgi:hypothetical protein
MRNQSFQWRTSCGAAFLVAAVTVGCTRDDAPAPVSVSAPAGSQRYVGCLGPTADPKTFVLSVAEGRDFTTGEAPGTPIPQKSELPEGAPPPAPPVPATSGTPGGGPTPVTKIVTYSLLDDGTANLRDHVGHTIEVVGTHTPPAADHPSATVSEGKLNVVSTRMVADYCK